MRRYRAVLIALAIAVVGIGLVGRSMKPGTLVATLLSGLTLGALYFLIAAGLSLIFGLMDVLNFAHGTLFMLGAYVAWTWVQNPHGLLLWAGLVLAVAGGSATAAWWLNWSPDRRPGRWTRRWLVAVGVALIGVTAWQWLRWPQALTLLLAAGGGLAVGLGAFRPPVVRPPHRRLVWRGVAVVGLLLVTVLLDAQGPTLASAVAGWGSNAKFVSAIVVGTLAGAVAGALMEWSLIRPLYERPIYQVLLTLGIVFAGNEVARAIWGVGAKRMEKPGWFGQPCRSESLAAWVYEQCASVMVLGRSFPTYRLFVIVLGVLLFVALIVLLRRSRLGMIIRAGVQDREMVEALGINVRQVFTLVFALGAGLAALGGVAAAPFVGVYPEMGLEYMLQAFIVVVIGGMGSVPGAALGALLVGLARAFGDYIVLSGVSLPWMEKAVRMSPSIARASTVLIMAIVLMVRPAGLFGEEE